MGRVAILFMKPAPTMPARLLKNSLPTACFFCSLPDFAAAAFFAFSSEYCPKPILYMALNQMLMPQVTGRVPSMECRYWVKSLVSSMPRFSEVSPTSLPVEYMTTEGWL